ncbi:hypothetical protein [Emticicia sp. C21]|uniref:hypothetical protein n=1 Tax=Emticicia sp. C21 TaxID=2302915 RepID=UPI000E3469D6|nr:hypothetical protein [Emticicia sp. C21]RFS15241.1 hypothetical protein D0T08_17085 [Emticicia sp. C21]
MPIPFKYTNRKEEDHYFRAVETAKGKIRYYIVKNKAGYTDLIEEIPNGFEVVELPEEGRVIFRKKIPKKITEQERLIVEDAVRELSAFNDFMIFVESNQIIVFHSQFNSLAGQEENLTAEEAKEMYGETKKWKRYFESMYFTLIDDRKRIFSVARPVFTQLFGRWNGTLEKSDDLMYLADKYCQHLGKDTFFDLIPLELEDE